MLRLSEELDDARLLPYLQHLTELSIAYGKRRPLSKQYLLPRWLLTRCLDSKPIHFLRPDTLPPCLRTLSLSVLKNLLLPAGVLPQSLTSLHLTSGFDASWPMGEGVLSASLLRLYLYEWTLPLSYIALPASLFELHIESLFTPHSQNLHSPLLTLT